VTGVRLLPSPTYEAWTDPDTFAAIAYWADTVSPDAHTLAHPSPVQGCPGCPPVTACQLCGQPPAVCVDLAGHRRIAAAGEVVR
jgi:hypothetical protein